MSSQSSIQVIIPAGGIGTRMGLSFPKQLLPFKGKTVLEHSVGLFAPLPVTVAAPADYRALFVDKLPKAVSVVDGGRTRFESVRRAFESLSQADDETLVVIHDAARPFFDPQTLDAACRVAADKGAVIYATAVSDTVKLANDEGTVLKTLDRDRIYLAQTPQIFKAGLLREAYKKAPKDLSPTDEAALMEHLGIEVQLFKASATNKKLTNPEDLAPLGAGPLRIGHGYDVHRFDASRPLFLGGILIPDTPGLLGHSDADVVLHALIDAMLGAAGLGDIGRWFPDNDPSFKGIRSTVLLERTKAALLEKGLTLANADITIMAQAPKLAPHIPEMCRKIGEILGVSESQVNIKATTTEGLGFVGRKEGMASQAVVLLSKEAF